MRDELSPRLGAIRAALDELRRDVDSCEIRQRARRDHAASLAIRRGRLASLSLGRHDPDLARVPALN